MILIKNADYVAQFNDEDTILRNTSIIIFDNQIIAIDKAGSMPQNELDCRNWFDLNRTLIKETLVAKDPNRTALSIERPPDKIKVIEAAGLLVMPGLVNTHHHFFQTLTRVTPGAQSVGLFDWLISHYEIWKRLTPDAFYVSAQVAMAELLLTGCTTTTDHLYLYPKDFPSGLIDEEIRAASEIGMRFIPTRGSMSRGKTDGGLPPDVVVQDEKFILDDCLRVIQSYHDVRPFAMLRIALAPCSPFSVSPDLMRETAEMSNKYKVKIHTHLAETADENEYCQEIYGKRPYDFCEEMGWMNERAWFAHCVYLNEGEVTRMANCGAGVAHCPTSNMRLASGIAPVPSMIEQGVPVGLGVDGSASNDSSNMLAEARQALLLNRLGGDPTAMSVSRALRCAVHDGAEIFGWGDVIGRLEPAYAADLIGIDLSGIEYAGATHDPVAAVIMCGVNRRVSFNIVNGQLLVENGELLTMDEAHVSDLAHRISRDLLKDSGVL